MVSASEFRNERAGVYDDFSFWFSNLSSSSHEICDCYILTSIRI